MTNADGEFSNQPAGAGLKYFFRPELREPLRREIRAQFQKFLNTGLSLDHVNGHLHFHLHPVVFRILMDEAPGLGIRRMRLTRDPFWLNARLAGGHWLYRGLHAFIYVCLAGNARKRLRRAGIRHTHRVFGLLQNGRVDEPVRHPAAGEIAGRRFGALLTSLARGI